MLQPYLEVQLSCERHVQSVCVCVTNGVCEVAGECRASARDNLKLMDVGAGKAAMSRVVPGFPSTVR